MKVLRVIVLMLLGYAASRAAPAYAQWEDLGIDGNVRSVAFFNADSGYCLSYAEGTPPVEWSIHKTTDGGTSWTSWPLPYRGADEIFQLQDFKDFWIAHHYVHTTDGGETWSIPPSRPEEIKNVFQLTSSHLFGGGTDYGIYESRDGGDYWTIRYSNSADSVSDGGDPRIEAMAFRGRIALAAGGSYRPTILRSTDSGTTWKFLSEDPERNAKGVGNALQFLFLTEHRVLFLSHNSFKISVDQGYTWKSYLPVSMYAFTMASPDSNHILLAGMTKGSSAKRIFAISSDGGTTWDTTLFDSTNSQFKCSYPSPKTAYVASWGKLYKWTAPVEAVTEALGPSPLRLAPTPSGFKILGELSPDAKLSIVDYLGRTVEIIRRSGTLGQTEIELPSSTLRPLFVIIEEDGQRAVLKY